ncbi:uncharacterized membrane protein YhaH (DUF805 family) [Elusimicrobium posterum]|uniref:DUF805 domain-containing protein n=1 Tax=Elusimicrobium posterum TaxID=3116653 RepID=UPI003C70F3EA
MGKILFSFSGKLDRGTFFKYSLVLVIIAFVIAVLFGSVMSGYFYGPGGLVGLVFLWMWLALFVKRGRDIGIPWPITVIVSLFLI